MILKCAFICLCLIQIISCDKSFTIVLDTTFSMEEELDVIKANLPSAINSTNTDITNYIIVPFNDPDVGTPIQVETATGLLSSLNGITVAGGQKCPENSLSGIEKALQISKDQSFIFVFTDAYSKDAYKLSSVENLCRTSHSKVVIFLSGQCIITESPSVNVQVYYDIAKTCSGAVLRFDPATLRQAFKFIKEVTNVEWTEVISDTFTSYKQLYVPVDSFTKTVLLVVSGESPKLEISTPDSSRRSIENILETRNAQIIRLTNPSVGHHTVSVRSEGRTSFVLYKMYELPLQFGFSTKRPRSLRETSRRPMPGRTNYILVTITESNIKLQSLEIQIANDQEKKVLALEETKESNFYLTSVFIAPEKSFRLWIKGYYISTYKEINGVTQNITPQAGITSEPRWTVPKAEILETESIIVDFGNNATVACKVSGYPAPNIVWEDDNLSVLPSESVLLEIPSLHISYASVENVTVNGTIYCKAKNSKGEDSQSLAVYVHRPFSFDIIQTPSDQTIEFGAGGKLYCQVSAYPEAKITWYHNYTKVSEFNDIQVELEKNALWIKNMSLQNIGQYKCEITNEENMKTFNAFVNISGIETPKVEVDKSNIVLKLGDWSYLQCRVIKGKPTPTITWTFKSEDGYDFDSLPEGVAIDEDGKLKIASAQANHKGVYKCDAANIEGHDSVEINVDLKYPPSISNSDSSTLVVKEDDDVVLPCEVNASPAASVRWELSQDDVLVPLDDRHHTDHKHTHRFKALWKDSGSYHCVAENDIGRAEKTIAVNVLVAPYIEAPKSKNIVARTGDNIVLMCKVMYGNPMPSTRWEFIALDSTLKVLSRSNSSSPLQLKNVNYSKEGSYLCIANNSVGMDSIQISVKIQ